MSNLSGHRAQTTRTPSFALWKDLDLEDLEDLAGRQFDTLCHTSGCDSWEDMVTWRMVAPVTRNLLDEPAPKHVLAVLPSGLLKTAEAASLLRERCDENSSTQNS